ncbi:peptidylprolyl isomerase [Micromonospora sp. HUAS YX12]|uniref:Peptidylprolyl isomerase n=1 Tax=Micromonospora sp. HUAS YX12 TaxID=3156396 RepID=A0AAU7R1D3_9ACTN
MTSTRDRQRAAARAKLEREMAERAGRARKRRQTQAIVGAAAVLVLVVAGTVWLVAALGDDDDKQGGTTAAAGAVQCAYTEVPKEGRPAQIKDVGLPPAQQSGKGTQTMTIDTNLGPITAKIDRAKVPCTAGSFTHLASKGFFDNTKCHRLVTEGIKVLQCGDPSATGKGWRDTDGTGGPSYNMAEENLPTDKRPPYPEGVIAMAKSTQPGSTGSQFFIVYGDSPLDPAYTVLGTITGGMDVVKQVAAAGDDGAFAQQAGGGHPKKEITMTKVTMSPIQGG